MQYKISNSCRFIKGHNAYFIYDLLRIKGYYTSLDVGNYLLGNEKSELSKVELEQINQLKKDEIIYQTTVHISKNIISKVNRHEPKEIITNLIIKYSNSFSDKKKSVILVNLIEELRIKNIQLKIESKYETKKIIDFVNLFSTSVIAHIEIVFVIPCDDAKLIQALSLNDRVQSIFVLKQQQVEPLIKHDKLLFISDKLYLKGAHLSKFSINKQLFDESQTHNTFFNKKMCIDYNGDIYNAIEYNKKFGNLFIDNSIIQLKKNINSVSFQKYWYVHKDLIDVCKQCEYRYMCVDNRLPIKRNEKEWYMETECNYNPYIAKWHEEEGYKTLEECGIESNGTGFKINKRKLNSVNKELWGND